MAAVVIAVFCSCSHGAIRNAMKLLVVTAIGASVITGLSVIGNFAAISVDSPGRRLAVVAALPAVPGQIAAAFLGIGHGAHGFASHRDVEPYIVTFVLWWGLLHFASRRLARRGGTSP